MTKYGYDIIKDYKVLGNSGDILFESKEKAIQDAKSYMPYVVEDEKLNGNTIQIEELEISIWECEEE